MSTVGSGPKRGKNSFAMPKPIPSNLRPLFRIVDPEAKVGLVVADGASAWTAQWRATTRGKGCPSQRARALLIASTQSMSISPMHFTIVVEARDQIVGRKERASHLAQTSPKRLDRRP